MLVCSLFIICELISINISVVLFSSLSKLLDRCTDGLAFGALKRCNECKDGHFSIR